MKIRIKGILPERTEDAPFIGALVCAVDCNINCKGCFNQDLKELPIIEVEADEIISKIISNPFNKGIILAGLEWTLQPEEMKELVYAAKHNGLEIMLYTGLTEETFKSRFPEVYWLSDIYIKFGIYDERLKCNNNFAYNVKLISSNQKIIKTKGETDFE